MAFQGISHFSLLKHMVLFFITAATPHWEGGDAGIGPALWGKGGGEGRKREGCLPLRAEGLLSAAALSSLACVRPSPQRPWPIVCGRGVLYLGYSSARPLLLSPSPENVFPVLWRESGKGVPGVLSSGEVCTSKEKAWADLSKLAWPCPLPLTPRRAVGIQARLVW